MSNKKYSDIVPHDQPPTFDQLVEVIEKNFKGYLEQSRAFTEEEIEAHWQRYKALNHLYQDTALHPSESAGVKGAVWVKAEDGEPKIGDYYYCEIDTDNGGLLKTIVEWAEFTNGVSHKYYDWDLENVQHFPGFKETARVIRWLDETASAAQSGKEEITDHEHEKEVMMQAFDKVRQLFEGRSWIMEGRGSYPYNDDRYKEEVRYLYDEFEAIRKDTWANIKSKTFEYRNKIIDQYKKESGKEYAVQFMNWTLTSECEYSCTDENQ